MIPYRRFNCRCLTVYMHILLIPHWYNREIERIDCRPFNVIHAQYAHNRVTRCSNRELDEFI